MGTNNPAQQGYEAYEQGIPLDENPYTLNTPDYDAWERGWGSADEDFVNSMEGKDDIIRDENYNLL